mgnify:CR=1 FL=1
MSHPGRLPWPDARLVAARAAALMASEEVTLDAALGRVLRRDVTAGIDIPHYASAAMDGWAVAGSAPWRLVDGPTVGRAAPPLLVWLAKAGSARVSCISACCCGARSSTILHVAHAPFGAIRPSLARRSSAAARAVRCANWDLSLKSGSQVHHSASCRGTINLRGKRWAAFGRTPLSRLRPSEHGFDDAVRRRVGRQYVRPAELAADPHLHLMKLRVGDDDGGRMCFEKALDGRPCRYEAELLPKAWLVVEKSRRAFEEGKAPVLMPCEIITSIPPWSPFSVSADGACADTSGRSRTNGS